MEFFRNMIQCCFPIEFWEMNDDLSLITSLNHDNEMLYYFFKYSNARQTAAKYIKDDPEEPALISCEGLCWAADYISEEKHLYLMGPFAMTRNAMYQIRNRYLKESRPFGRQDQIQAALDRLPLIPASDLFQYTIMFHYALTGEKIRVSDIRHPVVFEKEDELFSDNQKQSDIHHNGVWRAELQLMQAIQNGDLNYKKHLNQVALLSSGIHTKDQGSLRSTKDSLILFTGLCSRAAITGGVPAETAYDMCDSYADMIESAASVSELIHISDMMAEDCVHSVRRYQKHDQSRMVHQCCDYIRMHVSDKLTLQTLAQACGYSTCYLSRSFKAETGIPLTEYILHAKLDQACLILRTTSYTIQDISDSLSFSSRSYFSAAFQRYKGISPKEYRNQHRQK